MVARMKQPQAFGVADAEAPEFTDADFARAKPAREMLEQARAAAARARSADGAEQGQGDVGQVRKK